jgi:hypothetical protein
MIEAIGVDDPSLPQSDRHMAMGTFGGKFTHTSTVGNSSLSSNGAAVLRRRSIGRSSAGVRLPG